LKRRDHRPVRATSEVGVKSEPTPFGPSEGQAGSYRFVRIGTDKRDYRYLTTDWRPTGSNPFHPSRDPLAAILPLFPRCLQFPIPLDLNLVLFPAEQDREELGAKVEARAT
jgi:hypothetical protein